MCYSEFIGIRSCKDIKPKSGLYIDDLEGLNIHNIAKIVTDQPSAEEFLRQKLAFAVREYGQTILSFMEALEPEMLNTCEFSEDYEPTSFDQIGATYERTIGGLSGLFIRGVRINAEQSGELLVHISDGITTESKTFQITGGEQLLDFDFEPAGSKVHIYAENTLGLAIIECDDPVGCSSCSPSEGFKTSGYIDGNSSTEAYGFIPVLSIECVQEKAICTILHQVSQGVLYACGVAVLQEWQASDRLNYLSLHSDDWVAAKIEEWNAKAEHFYITNSTSINKFIQRVDPICYVCNETTIAYAKP